MIVPDINLLIYIFNKPSPFHLETKEWWNSVCRDSIPVGLPWCITTGFIRIMSNGRLTSDAVSVVAATAAMEAMLALPNVSVLEPGPRHMSIMKKLLADTQGGSNLVTDAHIAAIAIEHRATVASNDFDFQRFEGLNTINPLKKTKK